MTNSKDHFGFLQYGEGEPVFSLFYLHTDMLFL